MKMKHFQVACGLTREWLLFTIMSPKAQYSLAQYKSQHAIYMLGCGLVRW